MKRRLLAFITIMLMLVSSVYAFSFQIDDDDNFPTLRVSLLSYTPQPVQPGQVMDLNLQIENTGSPVNPSLEIIEEHPFILEENEDLRESGDLGVIGYSKLLQFRIRIAENAKDGIAPLKVRYKVNKDLDDYYETTFDINIQTFDARIEILKVEQIPREIIPGEQGKLILSLKNADDKPLKNIDVILDLTGSYDINSNMLNMISMQAMVNSRLEDINRRVASGLSPLSGATPMMNSMDESSPAKPSFDSLAPIGTSNQKRLHILRSNENIEIEFDIVAMPNIAPDIYAVPVYITYNDEDNNPFHLRADIPVRVNMEPELYIDMKSTTLRTTDFSGKVVFNVANRGLSDMRYLTLTLDENDDISLLTAPRSIYLGMLAPGESKEGSFDIIAHEKNISLPVKVEYRDSFNKLHEDAKEIPFYIINKNYYRDLPYEMWLAWLILGLVVLALSAFYVIHITKRKNA